ncbi:MAG: hypothetical protein FJ211_04925 [Ignavibacteria bacterium]|nr:hypothetical protein [Ignavibacteria bacterium]
MNIATIRLLADSYSREQLTEAEAQLLEELQPTIDVPGADEGEQLTHVIAALWALDHKSTAMCDTMTAVREYTKRVRQSIS